MRNGVLVCSFVSKNGDRCPFEFALGRGSDTGSFSFFFGLGAEYCNSEPFADEQDRHALRQDLADFLESVVRCERIIGRKGIAVEHYLPSKLLLDDAPLRFTFRSYYIWPFSASHREVQDYRPWVEQGDAQG